MERRGGEGKRKRISKFNIYIFFRRKSVNARNETACKDEINSFKALELFPSSRSREINCFSSRHSSYNSRSIVASFYRECLYFPRQASNIAMAELWKLNFLQWKSVRTFLSLSLSTTHARLVIYFQYKLPDLLAILITVYETIESLMTQFSQLARSLSE
jgi:hypothetical protein